MADDKVGIRYPPVGSLPSTPLDRRASLNPFGTADNNPGQNDDASDITLTEEELDMLTLLQAQGKKPENQSPTPGPAQSEKKPDPDNSTFKFFMPSSTVRIPTLMGAYNGDRCYQTVYGYCQIADIDEILTGEMIQPQDPEGFKECKVANKRIKGNTRISLACGGHAHLAGVKGAYNMIKALEGAYRSKGYTSREILWRTISRASLTDHKGGH